MNREIEKLTEEVLTINTQIDDLGRKSVPLILKCGEKLQTIKDSCKKAKKKWGDWQVENMDRISPATVWRYMRVYKISLLKDLQGKPVPSSFKGMTLNQVYEFCGLVSNQHDLPGLEPDTKNPGVGGAPPSLTPPGETDTDKEDDTDTNPKRRAKFDRYHSYLCHLQDLKKHQFSKEQESVLVKCGQVFVDWYIDHGGRVPVQQIEVVPTKKVI